MGVNTDSIVFTRSGRTCTLVNIFITVLSLQTRRTGACSLSRHLVGVTPGPLFAGVDVALVVKMANKSSLAKWTLTFIFTNFVHTSPARQARIDGTFVLVLFTIGSNETIDTDTFVSSFSVSASPMVLTRIVDSTFVHVLQTISASVVWRTLTRVSVDTIHTDAAVLANISIAVVNVYFAIGSGES